MHRARILHLAIGMVIVATAAGCSESDDAGESASTVTTGVAAAPVEPTEPPRTTTATTTPETTAAPSPSTAEGLREGMYRTAALSKDQFRATASAAGFAQADVDVFIGADRPYDTMVVSLRLAEGVWSLWLAYDGGAEEHGWRGTYKVVDADTVIATDPCGAITYRYTVDGDQLVLDMVDDQCVDGGVFELIAQTVLYETAPFTRQADQPDDSDQTASIYASTSFLVPFEVTLPTWLPATPSAETPNFVTWEAMDIDRAIRFLVPVNVYPPGAGVTAPVPDDYVSYLLAQADQGATITNVTETTIDGRPATVVTATVDGGLDSGLAGSLGCPEAGMMADDCFGIQPEVLLRIAAIDAGEHTLLVWVRDVKGAGDRSIEYGTFEAMLASLRFPDVAPTTSIAPASAIASPIDGTWTVEISLDELTSSPLLYDAGEINDGNWGTFTLTFAEGRVEETQENDRSAWSSAGTFSVDGDIINIDRANGERFVMSWRLAEDGTLVLERDDSLGVVPTPFVMKPWTRQP